MILAYLCVAKLAQIPLDLLMTRDIQLVPITGKSTPSPQLWLCRLDLLLEMIPTDTDMIEIEPARIN